ncbi:hypothetical protein [Brevibacillus aydinogluensis]|jgi:hypothetical protein|uniref:DUF2178 domain-containing protein n=1 Tax=Brevibacillus aydinogluensis TaxID=927786 RepID=A0AA48RD73_9BACL|nr:hypothetical protein [Brevibacillus aydinogluensis]CAJ1003680.1 DUF2178 domain-containing protein [Brevibacillus aydinogluensis]
MKMTARIWGAAIIGTATVIIAGFTAYKLLMGQPVGFNELMPTAVLLGSFFTAITWGSPEEGDGPAQDEELGRYITMKSAKISYFILIGLLFAALAVEKWAFDRENMALIVVTCFAMIVLPFTEWIVSRQYR